MKNHRNLITYRLAKPLRILRLILLLAGAATFQLNFSSAPPLYGQTAAGREISEPVATEPGTADWLAASMTGPIGEDPLNAGYAVPQESGNVGRLVRYALSQHPTLAEADAEILRQSGLRNQASRPPNPVFGYAASEIGGNGTAGQQGIFLSQEWVTAGKLEIACQTGNWRTKAAMEALNANRLRLSQRIQRQYWSVVAARRRIELLELTEKLLQQAIEINENLLTAGEGTRGALLQAKLEQSQVAVARRQAKIDLQAKTVALATSLGVQPDWLEQVESDPWPDQEIGDWPNPFINPFEHPVAHSAEPPGGPSLEGVPTAGPGSAPLAGVLPALQILSSPELAELQALIEAARWEVRLAQAQRVGNIESTTMVQHDFSNDNVIFGFQVGAALPVRDRKTGLIQAAQATVQQREAALRSRLRDLEIRWTEACQNYRTAREMTRAIQQDLLELVDQRLELASQAYREGEIDYLDLLTAQRSYISVQQTALDAQEQAALAWAVLQTLAITETPLPRDDFQLMR